MQSSLKSSSVTVGGRAIPISAIVLLTIAVHAPLLLMQLPLKSYDTNFHIFFAAHYAKHWFNPWNEKWFTGFSQTTYPPLQHQWIALFSHLMGLNLGYMLVQGIAIVLLPIGMYRYARLWVSERAASYAAVGSIFMGALPFLVYQSGQLSTTTAAPLYLNALPYFYEWSRQARGRSLLKGLALTFAAAAAHHVTLLFGAALFALPVLVLAIMDRKTDEADSTSGGVISRALIFGALATVGSVIVLLPYFLAFRLYPLTQLPIPHASRTNYLLQPEWGANFWLVPWGAMALALPYVFYRGLVSPRLRPLFVGFWFTFIFGLGGTTPLPRLLLGIKSALFGGPNPFDIVTFERFNFWAGLMALPIVGLLVAELIDRFGRKAAITAWVLAAATTAAAVAWPVYHPINQGAFNTDQVISFLNRDNHDRYRYITLGFGSMMSQVGTYANASSVDGEYNSARMVPEMRKYGAAQLNNSKYFGSAGMSALREVLQHADQYGLKYIFVRDRYYEPLLAFAGWRQEETYDNGNVTLWVKDGIPPAQKMDFAVPPPAWHGIMWGLFPIGSSILALFLVLLLPERERARTVEFPATEPVAEPVILREAR